MKSVNIAKFKTELGKYLGFVRKGEEVVVLDRKIPLARVIPIRENKNELIVEEALEPPMNLFKLKPKNVLKGSSSLDFLKEERED